ncbi:MAG: type II toxin-antitoxin system VapC family toxin [Saprospiraceae bacterium]|nr:type II toxin-antitoxin system VapC family toxin [Saprospiraceae bacterium]
MGTAYVIDSNAVIDYLMGKLPADGMVFLSKVIDQIPFVSVITKIEVLGFSAPLESYGVLLNFFDDAIVFGLTEEVAEKTIELRKQYKIKLPDAIIAATALVNGCTLISRNVTDFKAIVELSVVDPHDISLTA